jgi:hypothetical protein
MREQIYFFAQDWTASIALIAANKFDFARTPRETCSSATNAASRQENASRQKAEAQF